MIQNVTGNFYPFWRKSVHDFGFFKKYLQHVRWKFHFIIFIWQLSINLVV